MEEINLGQLEIYRLGRELSRIGWRIYQPLDWRAKKIIGDQFITATDSYGANVAEAQGRFHYLDRSKFFFNARGSLFEGLHWLNMMEERSLVQPRDAQEYHAVAYMIAPKLNRYINTLFERRAVHNSSGQAVKEWFSAKSTNQ